MHSTTGRLERLTFAASSGRSMTYVVVFLDQTLEREIFTGTSCSQFVRANRARFVGEVEDIPVELAWQPSPGRGHYAMISPELRKQLGLRLGSEVTVRFELVDPDRVVVPDDVARVLRAPRMAKRWNALTPGQQRALLAFVASARTGATREKRIGTLFEPLDRMPRAKRAARPKPTTATSRRGPKGRPTS